VKKSTFKQGCGSGSGFNDFVDSESGSGTMGKKNKKKNFSLTFKTFLQLKGRK
jgi:hypothetical protein